MDPIMRAINARPRPWLATDTVTEQLAAWKQEASATMSDLDDDDYPRECAVCGEYPRLGSLYCSSLCEAIMNGGDDDFRHGQQRTLT